MASLLGWRLDRYVIPVEQTESGGNEWVPSPEPGWEATGDAIQARIIPMPSEEQVLAGIDTPTVAVEVYCQLVDGKAPFSESTTLDVSDTTTLSGERYDVVSILVYDQPEFPTAVEAILTKL